MHLHHSQWPTRFSPDALLSRQKKKISIHGIFLLEITNVQSKSWLLAPGYPQNRGGQAEMFAWSYATCISPQGLFPACTCLSAEPAGAEEALRCWRWPKSHHRMLLLPSTRAVEGEKCTSCISCPVSPGVNLPWSVGQHFWIAKTRGFLMWILEMGGCFPARAKQFAQLLLGCVQPLRPVVLAPA